MMKRNHRQRKAREAKGRLKGKLAKKATTPRRSDRLLEAKGKRQQRRLRVHRLAKAKESTRAKSKVTEKVGSNGDVVTRCDIVVRCWDRRYQP